MPFRSHTKISVLWSDSTGTACTTNILFNYLKQGQRENNITLYFYHTLQYNKIFPEMETNYRDILINIQQYSIMTLYMTPGLKLTQIDWMGRAGNSSIF